VPPGAEDRVPIGGISRHDRAAAGKSGGRHQHIEPAAARHKLGDHGFCEIRVTHIAHMHRSVALGVAHDCDRFQ